MKTKFQIFSGQPEDQELQNEMLAMSKQLNNLLPKISGRVAYKLYVCFLYNAEFLEYFGKYGLRKRRQKKAS